METQSFIFAIDKITYFIGFKADGSKVSIKVLKNGTIEQQGTTGTGSAVNSTRPLKQGRYDFYKGNLSDYIKDQCNLSQAPLKATSDVTKQYRTAYEKAAFGTAVADLRLQAADDADGTIDEIASMRSQNTVMNRVLGSLQRELSKPKVEKKPKLVKEEKRSEKDGLTPSERKAANDAAKAARALYLSTVKVAVGDGGKLTVVA